MSKQTVGGIHNVLDGLLSPTRRSDEHTECEAAKPAERRGPEAAKLATSHALSRTVEARRGRPAGRSALAEPKSKVTFWLSRPLVESYRDWSWEARCQVSHLVERALTDYCGRERNPPPGKR
jgi:hypothetical protein